MTSELVAALIGGVAGVLALYTGFMVWFMTRLENKMEAQISKLDSDIKASTSDSNAKWMAANARIDATGARIDQTQAIIMKMLGMEPLRKPNTTEQAYGEQKP
jgi:hypothetical protein